MIILWFHVFKTFWFFNWIWKKLGQLIPQRVITAGMGFLSVVVAYSMRTCLSVAITEMVEMVPVISKNSENRSLVCDVLYLPVNQTHGNGSSVSSVSQYRFRIFSSEWFCVMNRLFRLFVRMMISLDFIGRKNNRDGSCHLFTLAMWWHTFPVVYWLKNLEGNGHCHLELC